jgi:predicted esterase
MNPTELRFQTAISLAFMLILTLVGQGPGAATEPDPVLMLTEYLQNAEASLAEIPQQSFGDVALTRDQSADALTLLTEAHYRRIRESRRAEHEAKRLSIGEWVMPYHMETFGERPKAGHSLYISMHGGGGAPKRVNDGQWENQKRLYQIEEGIYIAPRAPTDTWNLWHQEHIDPLFSRLIENMIAFESIDPDRVYITGYSAGGDGVFQVAPRMADRFAAAAMMAGHPNETQPLGLRNLPFTIHMGERDAAYNRNALALQWKQQLAELKQRDEKGYEHWVEIHKGKGHWVDRQDASGVKWMAQFRRTVLPERVVWLQDDVLHDRFYWVAVAPQQAAARQLLNVSHRDGTFTIEHADTQELTIYLRDDLANLDQSIKVQYKDQTLFDGKTDRTIGNLVNTLIDRGDPKTAFSARITVEIPRQSDAATPATFASP